MNRLNSVLSVVVVGTRGRRSDSRSGRTGLLGNSLIEGMLVRRLAVDLTGVTGVLSLELLEGHGGEDGTGEREKGESGRWMMDDG